MDGGLWHCTGDRDQDLEKKCKKAKWLSGEALQIAVKRREAKSKGEKERYKHLNADFQRIARRDKKAFLSDQCKEIQENNRMGKTRDLFSVDTSYKTSWCPSSHLIFPVSPDAIFETEPEHSLESFVSMPPLSIGSLTYSCGLFSVFKQFRLRNTQFHLESRLKWWAFHSVCRLYWDFIYPGDWLTSRGQCHWRSCIIP